MLLYGTGNDSEDFKIAYEILSKKMEYLLVERLFIIRALAKGKYLPLATKALMSQLAWQYQLKDRCRESQN